MSLKYMVLKLAELRKYLSPEEQAQFNALMQTLNAKRTELDPHLRPANYFTLNMNDKYALPAVEKYIEEVDFDVEHRTNTNVRAARKAAWDAREWALNNTDGTKVPT